MKDNITRLYTWEQLHPGEKQPYFDKAVELIQKGYIEVNLVPSEIERVARRMYYGDKKAG